MIAVASSDYLRQHTDLYLKGLIRRVETPGVIWSRSVPIDPTKTVTAVELPAGFPTVGSDGLTIVEMAVTGDPAPPPPDTTAPEASITLNGADVVLTGSDDRSIASGSVVLIPLGRSEQGDVSVGSTAELAWSNSLKRSWKVPANLASGKYLLRAEVIDGAGNSGTAKEEIVVILHGARLR